jgi:DNA polymerase I
MEVAGDPNFPRDISCVQVLNERKQRFEGPEKVVLADLLQFIKVHDPDIILFPYANTWVPIIVKKARRYGLEPKISHIGWLKQMASKYHYHFDTPRLCRLNI